MLAWLCRFPPAERTAFLHELLDPSYRVHVPVAMGGGDGWWFQITRRLLWVTPAADEQRLVEPLFPDAEEELRTLAAVDPLLIAGRVTSHPPDWAMAVRIWPSAGRPAGRPWWHLASAIHEHGIPILCLDLESTVEEIQRQLLMLAHWHKYVSAREPEIADAIAVAYPQAVARIVSATRASDTRAAAAMLFEGLLRPGFDPARGAAAARRYVNNEATIAILNHRKTSDGGIRPWEALGVSERRYYKLLNRFAPKTGRRYEVDADVLDRIRAHLIGRDKKTETHAAAMELLQERGFTYSAARKWLHRHPCNEALTAWPRSKTCDEVGLPLVALTREVRFAAIAQTVGECIVAEQLSELREAQRIHETFTELTTSEAGPDDILDAVQRMAGSSVVLETEQHQVLDYRAGPGDMSDFLARWPARSRAVPLDGRTGWDSSAGWLLARVGRRERGWGRLIIASPAPPSQGLVAIAERAAAALAMHRLHHRHRDSLTRRIHHELLLGLLADPTSPTCCGGWISPASRHPGVISSA